ncbi:MAG: glycosyltransferase family 4 protein [Brooklawnia sp.]|nr:glycosyltransferase family 4 protein [Brooklawnia sp.]
MSQYYVPEKAPTIPWDVARRLATLGHEVRVLTGYPNYPEGRIYPGYRQRWRGRENDGSVDVLRVPLFVDHSQSILRRSLNYVSFGLSVATARRFARDVDVIYVYATQMTPALGPWLWRLTGGAPYVLHVQDLWPDSITGSSMVSGSRAERLMSRVLNPWLSSTYQQAAAIIGIAPTMVNTLIDRGASKGRTHLVYNWAGETAAPEGLIDRGERPEGATVLFAGNVGDMQDLETAVRAAHSARESGIRLRIVGDGVALPHVRALADRLGAGNVTFEGRVPSEDVAQFYPSADHALVSLKDLPNFRGTIPSKFQAALSHGVPVITNVQGDLRALVENHGLGFTADAEDVESLASAFRAAAAQSDQQRAQMAARARRTYAEMFSQSSGISAIEEILVGAARGGRHKRGIDEGS